MRRLCLYALVVAVSSVVAGGCSKKREPDRGSSDPSTSAPNRPGRSPAGGGQKEPEKDDPDSAIAAFKAVDHTTDDYQGQKERHRALGRLLKAVPPTHPRRAEVFRLMVDTANTVPERGSHLDYLAFFQANVPAYAGPDEVPDLIALVNKSPDLVYSKWYDNVVKRLTELKDPRAAADAVRWWAGRRLGTTDFHAANLIRAIGPPAQSYLWPHARPKLESGKENSFERRGAAIALLAEVGTAESIPVLQEIADTPSRTSIPREAQRAIKSIQARAAKGP